MKASISLKKIEEYDIEITNFSQYICSGYLKLINMKISDLTLTPLSNEHETIIKVL